MTAFKRILYIVKIVCVSTERMEHPNILKRVNILCVFIVIKNLKKNKKIMKIIYIMNVKAGYYVKVIKRLNKGLKFVINVINILNNNNKKVKIH